MEPSEALGELRNRFLGGKHRLGEIFMHTEALEEIAGENEALLGEVSRLLDQATPGGNFHVWLDGGRLTDEGFVYFYDRKPAEVAGVIGKALLRAKRAEAA